jgi:hypothetical protein
MGTTIGSLVSVSGHNYSVVYDLFFTTERLIAILIETKEDVMPVFSR